MLLREKQPEDPSLWRLLTRPQLPTSVLLLGLWCGFPSPIPGGHRGTHTRSAGKGALAQERESDTGRCLSSSAPRELKVRRAVGMFMAALLLALRTEVPRCPRPGYGLRRARSGRCSAPQRGERPCSHSSPDGTRCVLLSEGSRTHRQCACDSICVTFRTR